MALPETTAHGDIKLAGLRSRDYHVFEGRGMRVPGFLPITLSHQHETTLRQPGR